MKKLLIVIALFAFVFGLTACEDEPPVVECTATQTLIDGVCVDNEEEPEETFDLGGRDIIIVVSNVNEWDPRLGEDYTGTCVLQIDACVALIEAAEAKYNINIVFELWGTAYNDRPGEMIANNIAGTPRGHVSEIASVWFSDLVKSGTIVDVTDIADEWANENWHPTAKKLGTYDGKVYGMSRHLISNVKSGIYYNATLLEQAGIADPAQKWLDGEWTWSDFQQWTIDANNALSLLETEDIDYHVLGGVYGEFIANLHFAQGGTFIDPDTFELQLTSTATLEAYQFTSDLLPYWEPEPSGSGGSEDWKSGQVLTQPGKLWYLTNTSRWIDIGFDIGFVPAPIGDDTARSDYGAPYPTASMFAFNTGVFDDDLTEELLFRIWNDIQHWETEEEHLFSVETTMEGVYYNQTSVDAHMSVIFDVRYDYTDAVAGYWGSTPEGLAYGINTIAQQSLEDKSYRAKLDAAEPLWQDYLDEYLNR